MKRIFRLNCFLIFSFVLINISACQPDSQFSKTDFQEIISGFKTPVDSNNLWEYWYWMNDDISKDGITKDLAIPEKTPILWTHRTMPGMDIYFITNQSDEAIKKPYLGNQ